MMEAATSLAVLRSIALLTPVEIDRPKARFGSPFDGGYILAEPLRPEQTVLSFGVGGNSDFEFDLAERGHAVHCFDPTVDGVPKPHRRVTFQPIGLAAERTENGRFLPLPDFLAAYGLAERSDTILKIDIEGGEYSSLYAVDPECLSCFEQISLEIHGLSKLIDRSFRRFFDGTLSRLVDKFAIFHVHANNYAPLTLVGGRGIPGRHVAGGVIAPEVLELSCIRRDLVKVAPSRTCYPTHLDTPNHPGLPDHILGFFPFFPNAVAATSALADAFALNDLRAAGGRPAV